MIITINEELGVVVAESKTKHGLSVCCPEDKFDLTLGVYLATQRMVPKDVGAWGLGSTVLTGSRAFFIRQREIHSRYVSGTKLTSTGSHLKNHLRERAATPPVEPSAPAEPSSQSHVTLTSGEYLRLLALEKRVSASRGTEPIDTRHPRDK